MDTRVEAFKPRFAAGSGVDRSLKRFLTNFDHSVLCAQSLELNPFWLSLNFSTEWKDDIITLRLRTMSPYIVIIWLGLLSRDKRLGPLDTPSRVGNLIKKQRPIDLVPRTRRDEAERRRTGRDLAIPVSLRRVTRRDRVIRVHGKARALVKPLRARSLFAYGTKEIGRER